MLNEFSSIPLLPAISLLILLLVGSRIIYNIYFHPLASFKGPKLLAASEIPLAVLSLRGESYHKLHAAHQKYGSIVRIAPNTLSFIDTAAWNDIYGNRKNRSALAALPKDPTFYNEMMLDRKTITLATDEEAAPIRRAMNAAFSHKALLEQETMMHEHVELLMSQLGGHAKAGQKIDIQKWFTFSMFDVTSDFAFGDDLGCVKNGRYHDWVQFVIDFFYAATLLHQCHKFWPMNRLLAMLIPASTRDKQAKHEAASLQRVRRRIDAQTDRHDFMYYFLRQAEKEKSITMPVIEAQASVVILAGSETSAVALTGAVYELLTHPDMYEKLKKEVRDAFATVEDITLSKVLTTLPYLSAVIQETLRVHTPLANGFNRVVPKDSTGAVICNTYIPPTTIVTINHFCAYRSETNFLRPHEFIPARWLDDPEFAADKREVVQPFSVGPRNCPGRSFALYNIHYTLAHLLWHFDLELGEGTQDWAKNQRIFNGWVQPPLPILLTRRSNGLDAKI